jgi:hypothetical protein
LGFWEVGVLPVVVPGDDEDVAVGELDDANGH